MAQQRGVAPTLPPQFNIEAGQGIAEYSNRSFVSAGTNFRFDGTYVITDPNFFSPAFDPETGYSIDIQTMVQSMPTCSVVTTLQGQLIFYGNLIIDSYPNTPYPDEFNMYATTLSIFDADLQETSEERFFSLNRFNFCAAQDRLIPRAVGYSGGLIDYFFRGKLETNYTEAQSQLTITVKNISGSENPLTSGTFELYYDATDGTRKSLAIITGANVGSTGIVNGDSWVITANTPNDVDTSKQNPYMLVYKGIVGTEEEVIGKVAVASACYQITDVGAVGEIGFTSQISINNNGQVVGTTGGFFNPHAFLYSNGIFTDLGTLGGTQSIAYGINNNGQVVGGAYTGALGPLGNSASHAFLYSGGRMLDLNNVIPPGSGWMLEWATGINNLGQIVGSGVFNGQEHAFLLTPTSCQ